MASDDFPADVQQIFESIHKITEANEVSLQRAGIDLETLKNIFAEGFLTVALPQNERGPFYYDQFFDGYGNADRAFQRNQYFYYMGYLGYYPDGFDWDSWRDLYETAT